METNMNTKRIIAIHLPQFYPFPENDEWWGKGFTEWRNVTKAKPRFLGHYQPHLPADLGFYDLRLKECRMEQEKMAKKYGIYGFCYYHYWFNGHLIMEKPVEAKLKNPEEDLPFMLCWANENWHRNWAGGFNETLIEQNYSKEDNIAHFKYLLQFFKDPRYIRVENKPVFAIYRVNLIPDLDEMVNTFRELALKEGLELYLIMVGGYNITLKPGFDAEMEFPPYNMPKKMLSFIHNPLYKLTLHFLGKAKFNNVFSYKKYVNELCKRPAFSKYKQFPGVCPSWDNSSRRVNQSFTVLKGSSPQLFQKLFNHVYNTFIPFSKDENFIFINAWNEWAEGNHLEPDLKWGLGYLDAIKNVINKDNKI